ncbi:acyltransferase [Micromonospora sp. CPCC 205371]|nr:acyltransferase [Micromonospora sp. CPCC 205371]
MGDRAGRDRYFDLLRAAAIARVVAYHMFPAAWLSFAFPAMGVMFGLGGSLMAASLDRSDGAPDRVVAGRLRRLLPAVWAFGAIMVPAMLWHGWPDRPQWPELLLWLLPLAEPPGAEWALPATEVLWYLVTYLWLVLLSPVLLWAYRRWPLRTAVLPLVTLVVVAGRGGVLTDLATYATCWTAGFAHRDGALRRIPLPALAALAAACMAGGAGWALAYGFDAPPAVALYSLGFVLPLLRAAPPMGWLARALPLDRLVSLVNARAVTIYLWHNPAIAACFVVGDALNAWVLGDAGYVLVAVALTVGAVTALGWVESLPAKARRVPGSR